MQLNRRSSVRELADFWRCLGAAALAAAMLVCLSEQAVAQAETEDNEANDLFGSSVAAGDFDGDGREDVAVGVPGENQGRGAVITFRGTAQGPRFWEVILQGDLGRGQSGDGFGGALAAGDFNGDGRDDLAIGAPGATPGRPNEAPPAETPDRPSSGTVPMDGDDGDLVDAPPAPVPPGGGGSRTRGGGALPGVTAGEGARSGAVLVFLGSRSGLVPDQNLGAQLIPMATQRTGDQFGQALAAGDFNGDGNADLAVGAPRNAALPGAARSGFVFLFRGATGVGLQPTPLESQLRGLAGASDADALGSAMVVADFNSDNIADLAIGAPGRAPTGGPGSGMVMVLRGSRGAGMNFAPAVLVDQELDDLGTNEAGDGFGSSMAAGDFDDDGNADLAISAPTEAPGQDPRAGFVFIFRGTSLGTFEGAQGLEQEARGSARFAGENEAADRFGMALAAADFDGDGNDDLVVGSPGNGARGRQRAGTAFVFLGRSSRGEPLEPDAVLSQLDQGIGRSSTGDRFGAALAAGDFDGDRRADVVIGAPGNGVVDSAGAVFVFGGGRGGLRGDQRMDQEAVTNAGLAGNAGRARRDRADDRDPGADLDREERDRDGDLGPARDRDRDRNRGPRGRRGRGF